MLFRSLNNNKNVNIPFGDFWDLYAKKQSLDEIDRLKKAYADMQAAKIAAERKKQEEQSKLWEQKKLEEQQKLLKLFSPRV